MILTGKALEDFIKYYKFGKFHFENVLDEKYQYAEIIEWLDSVGIYIEIRRSNNSPLNKGFHGYVIKSINGYYKCTTIPVKTRQEATEQAIIKANDIYNETKA